LLILLAGTVIAPAIARAGGKTVPTDPNASTARKDASVQSMKPPVRELPAKPARRTPASFTPQMPLNEAVDILRNCTTPPLNIVVLWRSLDGAGIYQDTPIGVDGLPGLRVRQYLDILVLSLSAGAGEKIGYVVDGGVLTIGATSALPAPKLVTRVYDITDLVAPPANYGLPPMGYGGMYGAPMMGPAGSYGGGLGAGSGMGVPSMPGGPFNTRDPRALSGPGGNSYGRRMR